MADRGRRALPSSNRITTDRWIEHCMTLHRHRLETMRATPTRCGTVDHTAPKTMELPHLRYNAKRAALEEYRQKEIQRENQKLVDKMERLACTRRTPKYFPEESSRPFHYRSTLHLQPGFRIDPTQYPIIDCHNSQASKSLNMEQRSRLFKRIQEDNSQMLKRIQKSRPVYSRNKWEDQWHRNMEYRENAASPLVRHLSTSLSKFKLPHSCNNDRPASCPAPQPFRGENSITSSIISWHPEKDSQTQNIWK